MENVTSKMNLLKQITMYAFMVEDLGLYLNTHPNDCEAVEKYNCNLSVLKELTDKYEEEYGMLSEHGSYSECPWEWIAEPWPWEAEANFRL